jgi:hypothetical protein
VPLHPSAPAHWIYLAGLIEASNLPGRYLVPRIVNTYGPKRGSACAAWKSATVKGYPTPTADPSDLIVSVEFSALAPSATAVTRQ